MKSLAFVLAALLGGVAACPAFTDGSGKVTTETRALSGVQAVELAGAGELSIVQGDKEELVVRADDNLLPLVKSTVGPDGTLRLDFRLSDGHATKPVAYQLTVKSLGAITLADTGVIDIGKLTTEKLSVRLSGVGKVTIKDLQTGALTVAIDSHGTGNFDLSGSATTQTVELKGVVGYNARHLKTDATSIRVAGDSASGMFTVWAEKTLSADLGGSGVQVGYVGNPKVDGKHSGGSTVHPIKAQ